MPRPLTARDYFLPYYKFLIELETTGYFTGFDQVAPSNFIVYNVKSVISDIIEFGEETSFEINALQRKIEEMISEKEKIKAAITIGNLNMFLAQEHMEPSRPETASEREEAFEVLKERLLTMSSDFEKVKLAHKEYWRHRNRVDVEVEKFREIDQSLIEKAKSGTDFDRFQVTLLFHYLREKGVFKGLSNEQIGIHANILTGFSRFKVKHFLPNIDSIKKDLKDFVSIKKKNSSDYENYNLQSVRALLAEIIQDIDATLGKK